MHTINDLSLYQKARVFRNEISKVARELPEEERYALRNQIIRSSRSISAQIAEGHGRYHYREMIQYCRIARGSLLETQDHVYVALDERYISDQQAEMLIDLQMELVRMLNGYIRYLKKKVETS